MKTQYDDLLAGMLNILNISRCPKIRKHDIDERLVFVRNSVEFNRVKTFYEEMPASYWANLIMMDDAPDLEELGIRCKALKVLWKATFNTKPLKQEAETQGDSNEEASTKIQ